MQGRAASHVRRPAATELELAQVKPETDGDAINKLAGWPQPAGAAHVVRTPWAPAAVPLLLPIRSGLAPRRAVWGHGGASASVPCRCD